MPFLILIAFIAVPLLEIAVFIEVGGRIGLWPTIGTVILTAVIGTALLRQQGLSVLFRIRENMEANRLPIREFFDGICLVLAGALLLTPGFVTDAVGFLLMVPPLRSALAAEVARRFLAGAEVHVRGAPPGFDPPPGGPGGRTGGGPGDRPGGGPVIDGEFQDITPAQSGGDGGAESPPGCLPPERRDP